MENLVSVMTPVYRAHRDYLKRSIENTINQTCDSPEFITNIDSSTNKKNYENMRHYTNLLRFC